MEFEQILAQRWSCRAFTDEPVPREVLEQIFALAQRTASWCNTQSWQVHLVSGQARDRFSKALVEAVISGQGGSDLPMPTEYVGVYNERRRESGFALYEALGIAREDKMARGMQMLKNYEFFGAPHVAVITTDVAQGTYGAVDCGGYVTNLMNAAQQAGVASCAQAAIAMQAPAVHEALELPAERLVVCGVALGYPDLAHPANSFRTSRAEAAAVVTYLD